MKLIILLLFPILSFGQNKLDKTISLFENKVEILVPKALSKMSDEIWTLKYRNAQRPELVLTDEDAEINLLVDLTKQILTESQLVQYKDMRIGNLKKRPDVKILTEGVKSINGKKIGFIKFSSQASDQNIFNFYFFTIVNEKVLLFTFNCIEKLQPTWEKTAEEILSSVRIK